MSQDASKKKYQEENTTTSTEEHTAAQTAASAAEGARRRVIAALVILWVVIGIIGFVYSILCFGMSGSMAEKVVGLLLSIFFGPFYWIYYFANSSYCMPLSAKMNSGSTKRNK